MEHQKKRVEVFWNGEKMTMEGTLEAENV